MTCLRDGVEYTYEKLNEENLQLNNVSAEDDAE